MSSGEPYSYPTQSTNGNQPNVVAVTPNNKFMYTGSADGNIDAYSVNTDGTLVILGAPFANAGSVRGLAIDPAGKFLFASDYNNARIYTFSINQSTGRLTLVTFTGVGTQPRGLATDSGGHLYAALSGANSVGQYNIDSSTGALSSIASPIAAGTTPDRVVVTPNGQNVYVSNFGADTISGYSIGGGGALSLVGNTTVGTLPLGLAVHQNGQFLIITLNGFGTTDNVLVYRINAGGSLTSVATGSSLGSTGAAATGVTIDPTGQYLYVANGAANSISKFNFNSVTGGLSARVTFATGNVPQFLLSRPAPSGAVPAASTWSLALLAMLLTGASALMYRRAYR
jgi:6-phosphogluconolactonase (cycloisomerase 2 family)